MKKPVLTYEGASKFAAEKFSSLSEPHQTWNRLHSEAIIEALRDLGAFSHLDEKKLSALAWVHDIGKIKGEEDHPNKGLVILEKHFALDDVERDCVLNHGSKSKPSTPEGKIFRYADGLSLFYPQTVLFRFHSDGVEGSSYDHVVKDMQNLYTKYSKAYEDSPKAIALLKKLHSLFENVNFSL